MEKKIFSYLQKFTNLNTWHRNAVVGNLLKLNQYCKEIACPKVDHSMCQESIQTQLNQNFVYHLELIKLLFMILLNTKLFLNSFSMTMNVILISEEVKDSRYHSRTIKKNHCL